MIGAIVTAVLLVAAIFFFRKASKDQSKWGINLNSVYCPVCNTKQPVVRMPESVDQAMGSKMRGRIIRPIHIIGAKKRPARVLPLELRPLRGRF